MQKQHSAPSSFFGPSSLFRWEKQDHIEKPALKSLQAAAASEPPARAWSFLLFFLFVAVLGGLLLLISQIYYQKKLDLSNSLLLNTAQASLSQADTFPTHGPSTMVMLPDDWAHNHPSYSGAIWYRLRFQRPINPEAQPLFAAYIERACTNLEVHLNGQLIYRGGYMHEPLTRNCYYPQLITIPGFLLKPGQNELDIKLMGHALEQVSARQRSGGLSPIRVGTQNAMQRLYNYQLFWSVTLSQIAASIIFLVGLFALLLAYIRQLNYLAYFGLMSISWSLLSIRLWARDIPLSASLVEILSALGFVPMVAFIIKFLLSYSGQAFTSEKGQKLNQIVTYLLWLQTILLGLSLATVGSQALFQICRLWAVLFTLEIFAAELYFLQAARQSQKPKFLMICVILGLAALVTGTELIFQFGWTQPGWQWQIANFIMPLLFGLVATRLIKVYAQAMNEAENARNQLEHRIEEITSDIERNFTQLAQLRVEQIAEKERKRIAADLHDDLGAKLLTIVHTSDNDRISTLAREALEEMRLSVKGLTGKPVQLTDALADWRSEIVSRLGQAGIDVDWVSTVDPLQSFPLSARIFVQTTRILREAVSNIIKHSKATKCVITFQVDNNDFQLIIQDNGKGIPMELDGKLDRGHGMASMKGRAKQLQGQCLVESGPGYGTTIRLTLPLDTHTPPVKKSVTSSRG